jgi:serine/threonine protein kinase
MSLYQTYCVTTNPSVDDRNFYFKCKNSKKYVAERKIGQGGIGQVFLCREEVQSGWMTFYTEKPAKQEYIALKKVSSDTVTCQYILDAIDRMRTISHTHIAPIFDAYDFESSTANSRYVYLTMPYYALGDLELFSKTRNGSLLPQSSILDIMRQLADALQTLHTQVPTVIHRDLSKENIFVQKIAGDFLHVVLGDFDLVKEIEGPENHSIAGKPRYWSPEVSRGFKYGVKTDIWSLGVVLLELMLLDKANKEGEGYMAAIIIDAESEKRQHEIMRQRLSSVETYDPRLIEKVIQMMSLDPKYRPTAKELLDFYEKMEHGLDKIMIVVNIILEDPNNLGKIPQGIQLKRYVYCNEVD